MDYGQYTSLSQYGNRSLYQPRPQQPQQRQDQQQQQGQDQVQAQVQDQIQQLPQLGEEQVRQLQQEQHLNSPQHLQGQPFTQGFVPPPPGSPWDSPLESLGTPTSTFGFADMQFAAAMNMVAAVTAMGGYGHTRQDSVHPPIATLEVSEAQARADSSALTPSSGTSVATPGSTSTASPMAVRNEMMLKEPQAYVQAQPEAHVQCKPQQELREAQMQYQPPQVIQLDERPQRKIRTRARANQQTPRAQAQIRKQRQGEKQEESLSQVQSKAQTRPSSSQSVSKPPVEQSQSRPAAPHPSPLVTSVPPAGQWYDLHTLAESQHRTDSATEVKKNFIGKLPAELPTQNIRESAHPYSPRLRQRRSVSEPTAFRESNSTSDVANKTSTSNNAPSPSTSLPAPSPVSASPSTSTRTVIPKAPSSSSSACRSSPHYLVRTDVYYDVNSNTLIAMLEIPGVPRAAIRVAVGDDKTGTRKLVVRGSMRRIAFPPHACFNDKGKAIDSTDAIIIKEVQDDDFGYVWRERKVGEFKRILVVPPETKPEDIQVSMMDGIMFLRYPAGDQTEALARMNSTHIAGNNSSAAAHADTQTSPQLMQGPGLVQSQNSPTGSSSTAMQTTRDDRNQYVNPGGKQINFRVETTGTLSGTRSGGVPSSSASTSERTNNSG